MTFPIGTFFVNIVGSFLIGLLATWFALRTETDGLLRLFLATGMLGGFTTFSAFSLDSALLWERGATSAAVLYVIGSVTLSLSQ
jgi:CrcB protein